MEGVRVILDLLHLAALRTLISPLILFQRNSGNSPVNWRVF
jgi:hypothetical protein